MARELGVSFGAFMRRATGREAFPFQERLAVEGLPELLRVPPGSGKTEAAVLPWLWRLLEHPDAGVRAGTPGRLVFVLPMRTLVEQVVDKVTAWVGELGLGGEVGVHVLMGGEARDDDAWQMDPFRPAVFVGTQDMVLSRLLLRGYGDARARWPVPFGLLHNGSQFIFDETQLMGPALWTSVQLQALREKLGTAVGSSSMWMSATVDPVELVTADRTVPPVPVELSAADRGTEVLAERLGALRRIERLVVPDEPKDYPGAVAEALARRHVAGTRTLAFFNTVRRAVEVAQTLSRQFSGAGAAPEVVLVHGQFRPGDRRRLVDRVMAGCAGAGQIVVSTQALEAGVDMTSRVLFTEVAPWTSVLQRCGRCNRTGDDPGAEVLWAWPPGGKRASAPYPEEELAASAETLAGWEGAEVTLPEMLGTSVVQQKVEYLQLRRRDLLQPWDTMPDLSGADVDVSRWIRDGQELTGQVAWRSWSEGRPGEEGERFPGRDELCPAPLDDLRGLAKAGRLWLYDQVDGLWRRVAPKGVRPGEVFLMDARLGGYQVETGWAPKSRTPVPVVAARTRAADGLAGDRWSQGDRWVSLAEHGRDVEAELAGLLASAGEAVDVSPAQRLAARVAARHHDLGKSHEVFCCSLARAAGDAVPPGEGPWAKGPGERLRHERPYFRHELVTALMMLDPSSGLLDEVEEADLAVYLAAAHHGKVRVSVRSVGAEGESRTPRLLGVEQGEAVGPVETSDGRLVPEIKLDLSVMALGGSTNAVGDSWVQRVVALRDRLDAGPFRVGWLEALVRMADWRASRSYRTDPPPELPESGTLPRQRAAASSGESEGKQEELW
ncbi:type I-G CRISPR-associated helicase/endonuclease Cas3g [Streptomyces profundus]|uniref:type I-G CRISPR-associated helicase/endonuclease Cas3g n=1 Tax=Streptomyces profundus TaxID=2867410 RepID=UPI002240E984|nr:DEAD/DEAH box helicase [Streptomyces sp. MA3_2.13]UED86307.1 DEAD/DEAH box helicase [Streptomyces sp. MA3_2.13]